MKGIYSLEVGDPAPLFRLPSHLGEEVELDAYHGRCAVVLIFHPLCFTPVCLNEIKEFQQVRGGFDEAGSQLLVVSVDSVPAKKAWAAEMGGIDIPMLADFWPHGHVSAQYGVLRGEGISERAVFVVDKQGAIAWKKVYPLTELPDTAEILDVVKGLA